MHLKILMQSLYNTFSLKYFFKILNFINIIFFIFLIKILIKIIFNLINSIAKILFFQIKYQSFVYYNFKKESFKYRKVYNKQI